MDSKVKWFNDKMGYGFIEYKENGNVLVHLFNGDSSKEFELISNGDNYNLKEKQKTA